MPFIYLLSNFCNKRFHETAFKKNVIKKFLTRNLSHLPSINIFLLIENFIFLRNRSFKKNYRIMSPPLFAGNIIRN